MHTVTAPKDSNAVSPELRRSVFPRCTAGRRQGNTETRPFNTRRYWMLGDGRVVNRGIYLVHNSEMQHRMTLITDMDATNFQRSRNSIARIEELEGHCSQ